MSGAYVKDPRVDEYIDALPEWQAAICAVYEGERVPARPLGAMFARIIADNRAGGRRKLKAERGG